MADEKLEEEFVRGAALHNVTALKVIEYFLYFYAIYAFSGNLIRKANEFAELSNPVMHSVVWITTCFFMAAFVLVIVRVYIDIHSIDYEFGVGKEFHSFVDGNTGAHMLVERLLRLTIVFLVIVVPKPYPGSITSIFNYSIEFIKSILINLSNSVLAIFSGKRGLLEWHASVGVQSTPADSQFHQTIEYYSSVLFAVGLMLLLWDLVNASSIQSRLTASAFEYNPRSSAARARNSNLFSFLDFVGIRNSFDSAIRDDDHYDIAIRRAGDPRIIIQKSVKKGRLYLLYIRYSPRFKERICVLLFALFSIMCSRSELNLICVLMMAATITLFCVFAVRDSKIRIGTLNMLLLPFKYFIQQGAVDTHGERRPPFMHSSFEKIRARIRGRKS